MSEIIGIITPGAPINVSIIGTGPKGEKGDSGDKFYVHDQISPSDTWEIIHNLDKYPSVSVVDSAGSKVIGDVSYVSMNELIVHFSAGFSGKAYLN